VWREIRHRTPSGPRREFLTGTALAVLFFTIQLQSIVFVAAILFPLVQAFAVIAIVCLLEATSPEPDRRKRSWFGWAAVAAMAAFFATFFGSGLAYVNVAAAGSLGALLFLIGCVAVWRLMRDRSSASRADHFAVGVMLFSIASAAMATPGRAQFGALQAAQ